MPFTVASKLFREVEDARFSQEQIDLFVGAHERFVRRQPRGRRAVMRFLRLPGLDFSRRLLVEAEFTGADLQGARLEDADLERAAFYCADLRGADLRRANLLRADLRGASLREADLAGANLDEADMRQAVLGHAESPLGLRLAGRSANADLGRGELAFAVDFTNCSMKRCRLARARLKGADFSGALLDGADLSGADLTGARFEGAVLTGAGLNGTRLDDGALAGCLLDPAPAALARAPALLARLEAAGRWIASNGAEGEAARLDDEDLRPLGPAFEGRLLGATSAARACAVGVSFARAQLQGARFDGADLRDADFTGADLRGACFRGANLWHARFHGADLRPLPVSSGAVAVDLEGARHAADAFAGARRG